MTSSIRPPRWRRLVASASAAAVAILGVSGVALPSAAAATDTATSTPATGTVSNGTLSWGLKQSFRSYVKGGAQGDIEMGAPASQASGNGVFSFPGGQGTLTNGVGTLAFDGSVHITGHGGAMDLMYSDLKVKLTSSTTGELIADAEAPTTSMTPAIDLNDVTIADLSFSAGDLAVVDDTVSLSAASTTLTEQGSKAFGGFYPAGTAMDPVSFTATLPEPAKFEPKTTATVTGASKANGLSLNVSGTGYSALPKNAKGETAAGVYVALLDHSKQTPSTGLGIGAGEFVAPQAFVYETRAITDGAWSTSLTVPAANLDKNTEYDVVVWIAHGNLTKATQAYRAPVNLSADQKAALFPAEPTEEPAPDPTDEPTTDPTDEPTTEPTRPAADRTLKATASTADGKNTIAVKGTGFTNLPAASTGKDAAGVYVAAFPADTDLSKVTGENMPNYVANDGKAVTWIMPTKIKDGAFSTDLDLGTTSGDVQLVTWVAHGNITAATTLDNQTVTLAKVADTDQPGDASSTGKDDQAPGKDDETSTGNDEQPAGTDNTSNANGTVTTSDAKLNWGIKESFRKYVVGNIAKGKFSTTDGATQAKDNGVFTFSGGTGTIKDGKGTVAFKGSVHVTGHHGEMDMTLSDLKVKLTSGTTGQLIADVKAPKTSMTAAIDLNDATIADLKFAAKDYAIAGVPVGKTAAAAKQALSLNNATVTLTADGSKALGGFYDAGTVVDPLSINGSASAAAAQGGNAGQDAVTALAANGQTPGLSAVTGEDAADSAAGSGTDATTGGSSTAADAAQQCRTVQVPVTTDSGTAQGSTQGEQGSSAQGSNGGSVSGASLSWGVKRSFVSYTQGGIANGKVSASNGAANTGSSFTWGSGSGTLSTSGTGTVSFPGAVRFTGHDGIMDTTLSGLRVKITGNGTATLIANVKSSDMEGKDLSASNVAFANVRFSGSAANGINGASVTLTAAGAKAFAGFYSAGQAMDPLTLTVPAKANKASAVTKTASTTTVKMETKVVCGDLASTGSDSLNLIGTAGVLALLGAAAVTFAARRRSLAAQR